VGLRKKAEIGTRVELVAGSPSAPTRCYQGGKGKVVAHSSATDTYTVELDDGEVVRTTGRNLKREDLGYGKRTRA
jgi:hypothetical protein